MRGENMATTWHVIDNRLTHDDLPEPLTALMSEPYLPFWWYVENDRPRTSALPEPVYRGAFCNCTKLATAHIPESVKYIGPYAFRNTALTKVKIASDCVFSSTSFPEECVIEFYESEVENSG